MPYNILDIGIERDNKMRVFKLKWVRNKLPICPICKKQIEIEDSYIRMNNGKMVHEKCWKSVQTFVDKLANWVENLLEDWVKK